MRNKMCKTLPLAIAVLLAGVGVVFAGQNADVIFALDSPAGFAGIGPGEDVEFTISATGLVGVKQYNIMLKVTPAEAFDLASPTSRTFQVGIAGFISPGTLADAAAGTVEGGAVHFTGQADGDQVLGTFKLTTAADFTSGTQATIEAIQIIVGPSFTDRDADDVFDAASLAAMGLSATVNPPLPAPTVDSIDPNLGSVSGGITVTITGTNFQDGATVTIGANEATEVIFVDDSTLTAVVPAGEAGTVDVVVTNPDAMSATLADGFTYMTVVEPTLTAATPADASLDYSAFGEGDVADGSAGEVTFSVMFTDITGAAAAGQTISWLITNLGSEPVYVLGATVAEIVANENLTVEVVTDDSGMASILLDAEGDRMAGTTSISVAAGTTAPNTEGVERMLSSEFSATWDVPVVAELASMWSMATPTEVLLQWSVVSQSNNLGWEVFRSTDNVSFQQVGELISGDGTSDEFKTYRFSDADLPQVEVLYYYLSQIDLNGSRTRSEVIEVALATATQPLPVSTALLQNFPNPFNPETTIGFALRETAVVTLTIYDLTGRVVRTLVDSQVMTAGNYRQLWDGRNESGVMVGSGVYFYQLNAGTFKEAKKMILVQ